MCDIYAATCEEPGCETVMGMHIGDFSHPRDAVHVRCVDHPPPLDEEKRVPGWWVFVAIEPIDLDYDRPEDRVVFVRLDGHDSPDAEDVCPNTGVYTLAAPVVDYDYDQIRRGGECVPH